MSKKYIDVNRLAISMVTMLICSFVLSCAGVSWFLQDANSTILIYIDQFIGRYNLGPWYSGLFLTLDVILISSMVSNNFSRTWTRILPIVYILSVAISASGFQFLPAVATLFLSLTFHKNISKLYVIIRYVEVNAIIAAYQLVSMKIKTSVMSTTPDLGIAGSTLFFIDYTIFLIVMLIVYKVGGENNGQKEEAGAQPCLVFMVLVGQTKGAVQSLKNRQKSSKPTEKRKREIADVAIFYLGQIFQLSLIAIGNALNNRLIVFIAMFLLGFLPQKLSSKTGESYHADTFLRCTFISFVLFYALSASSPPVYISMLACVAIGGGAAAMLDWLQRKITGNVALEDLLPEDIEYLIGQSLHDERSIEMARMWWIEGKTNREVADAVDRYESTVKALKKTIRESMEEARK